MRLCQFDAAGIQHLSQQAGTAFEQPITKLMVGFDGGSQAG
jgi:hypothetical protein